MAGISWNAAEEEDRLMTMHTQMHGPPEPRLLRLGEPECLLDFGIWQYEREVRILLSFGRRDPLTQSVLEEAMGEIEGFVSLLPGLQIRAQFLYAKEPPRAEMLWFQERLGALYPDYEDLGTSDTGPHW